MKNVAPLMLAATLTLSSFSAERFNENLRPAEVTARGLITALRQSSEARFVALFPTLAEFHRQMDANKVFYGLNLEAAKEDFAKTYNEELVPAVRRAYSSLVEEGEKRGINWSDVSIINVEVSDSGAVMTFNWNAQKFSLLIERSLMIEGRWRISQYVRFA
jgi:hypothetical protein